MVLIAVVVVLAVLVVAVTVAVVVDVVLPLDESEDPESVPSFSISKCIGFDAKSCTELNPESLRGRSV